VILIVAAPTTTARVSGIVFALSVAALYGASAAYHRVPWSPKSLRWMKRLDHSLIFVLIAGTYTPFSLLVLPRPWSVVILAVVWGGTVAGIVLKMVRIDGFHALTGTLYIALGWVAVLGFPQIVRGLSAPAVALLLSGGILYTLGAIVLARRRPDPLPETFGYHEVWHSMVIGGSVCHYVVVFLVFSAIS
jgi:hemolysin III